MNRDRTAGINGWVAYALVWAALGLGYALILHATNRTTTPLDALIAGTAQFGVGALIGVVVWHISGRLTPARVGMPLFVAAQALMAISFSGLWLAIQYAYLLAVAPPGTAQTVLRLSGLWQLMYGSFLYGAVAAGAYAVRATNALREQQVAAARAQAVAIRAQLNPHFLFNALHSLTALARRDPAATEQALERLGELLRYALDDMSGDTVALEDEWRFAQAYLDLERIRLGDRLRVDARIAEDAKACDVPPFVLQPLIENAVRHGIAPRPEGGRLAISASRDNGRLLLSVQDDGPGADPAALAKASGLGLRAVRQLVAARYDGQGSVDVDTRQGAGFRVAVSIPARESR